MGSPYVVVQVADIINIIRRIETKYYKSLLTHNGTAMIIFIIIHKHNNINVLKLLNYTSNQNRLKTTKFFDLM